MRVAHLCMQDYGGAGSAAFRIHKALLDKGIDSTFHVLEKWKNNLEIELLAYNYSNICIFKKNNRLIYSNSTWCQKQKDWNDIKNKNKFHDKNLELFTDTKSNIDLNSNSAIKNADIIQLHWVAGLVDFHGENSKILHGKHIVWRFSDINPFSGGCHYARGCYKYTTSCGSCPQLGSNFEKDISRLNWLHKKIAYSNLDITCVAPSKWIANEARKSTLLGQNNIYTVTNCVPLDIFKPKNKLKSRHALGIPEDSFVILFGAASLENTRKGFFYVIEAIKYLKKYSKIYLLSFGNCTKEIKQKINIPWIELNFIDKEEHLAQIYSSADVFLLPSLEENLPSVALESLSCGVPVVGFASGGIPEIVQHKVNGYLSKTEDASELARGIEWIIERKTAGDDFTKICREWAECNFSEQRCSSKYLDIYKKILYNEDKKLYYKNHKSTYKSYCDVKQAIQEEISIACYEDTKSWILGKFATKLYDNINAAGHKAIITTKETYSDNIIHHIPFLGWNKSRKGTIETLMVTHIDTEHKFQMLERQICIADMAICLSRDTAQMLISRGLPKNKICWVNPGHDATIKPRKTCIGITSRLYGDARKREHYLIKALSKFSPNEFSIRIMGDGWNEIVNILKTMGFEVVYYQNFDYDIYINFFSTIDYYIYFGLDEGSMGFIDALHAGVPTIVTPQGFHLDTSLGIDYPFINIDELHSILNTISSPVKNRQKSVSHWTWKEYTRKHLNIWLYIKETKNIFIKNIVREFLSKNFNHRINNRIIAHHNIICPTTLLNLANEALNDKSNGKIIAKYFARKALVFSPNIEMNENLKSLIYMYN